MALVVEMSPESEAMIRMKAAIRVMEVTEYVLFLIDLNESQSEQNAEGDDAHKTTEDQSAETNER